MNVGEYIASFYQGTKDPNLDAMKFFMDEFEHPEKKLNIIHIAGTNGKGSVAEMMTNILICAGYKVGKFISPHLIRFNERISINNQDICDTEMEKLLEEIKIKVDKYNQENENKITWFEVETTMALLYFSRKKCDLVVLETGLGGLYDCTNIIEKPIISMIASIGYDHMNILGNTLVEIAEQKAGIIKQGSETVFFEQDDEVNDVIIQKCEEKNNKLHILKKQDVLNYSYDNDFQKFDYKGYESLLVNLKGEKQIYNAVMCIEGVEILKNKGFEIAEECMRNGLKSVIHKGRFEVINKSPLIVYDGGHNKPAIENLKNSINMYYKDWKRVYVISILNRKDYKVILNDILEEDSIFIFTGGNSEEYVSKDELFNTAKNYSNNKNLYAMDLGEAIELVVEKYKDCAVFIIGSFYIYGDVIKKLKEVRND